MQTEYEMPLSTRNGDRFEVTPATLPLLRRVPILLSLEDNQMHSLDGGLVRTLNAGEVLVHQGEVCRNFWMLLRGSMRLTQPLSEGFQPTTHTMGEGWSFGEVPLLANMASPLNVEALEACTLLQLDEEQFWQLMTLCPAVRRAILGNMAWRLQRTQQTVSQQEKMATLGTLAAGLMHELNNPGAAARRASSQLRENLNRLLRLSQKFSRVELPRDQKQCMYELQEFALREHAPLELSELEQSDAQETLAEWMDEAQVEDAWRLAPGLVTMGFTPDTLACARHSFAPELFSDALTWLEALVSSMQLVGTIEESIGRVSDLVMAVKHYAYEGRGQRQSIDINKSLKATLVILGHKLREKSIVLQKSLGADLPALESECHGANQIWTNLLDNAIDASEPGGVIEITTWAEHKAPHGPELCVRIHDHGGGIPVESQPHIFDPFYTTKAAGVGTGLGLGIVGRVVEQFGGAVRFSSAPGDTEFVVRLPSKR